MFKNALRKTGDRHGRRDSDEARRFGVIVAVCATVVFGARCWAQVDPAWLESWSEATRQKPERLASHGRIASSDEPGIPLVIHGLVVGPNGRPAAGVSIHAYHRDRDGLEFGPPDNPQTLWRLNGWARTDAQGRFAFRTVRPAPDNRGREAAHVHFTVESPDHGRQWLPKVFFADDPLVTARQRQRSDKAGEFGSVRTPRVVDGIEHIDVRFRLKASGDF